MEVHAARALLANPQLTLRERVARASAVLKARLCSRDDEDTMVC